MLIVRQGINLSPAHGVLNDGLDFGDKPGTITITIVFLLFCYSFGCCL
jgi:hypothetical protein